MTQWTNNTTYIETLNTMLPGLGQFAFPASQNASANANTLDDYEEGTFTPNIGGSATYTGQFGNYRKIGASVAIQIQLTINAIGTGSTGVISGLPFSANGGYAGSVGYYSGSATNYTFVSCTVATTQLTLTAIAAAGATMTTPAVFFANGASVYASSTYFV